MNNIYLIGFMGAGKTTVGKCLADANGFKFIDLDYEIEQFAGMTIPQIFTDKGESGFRNIETDCLRRVSSLSGQIISTGGGIVERSENIRIMSETGRSVFLEVDIETLLHRISKSDNRPLAVQEDNWKTTRELHRKRLESYRKADLIIDANNLSVDEIVLEIKSQFG